MAWKLLAVLEPLFLACDLISLGNQMSGGIFFLVLGSW
jgi:hypothetical protein